MKNKRIGIALLIIIVLIMGYIFLEPEYKDYKRLINNKEEYNELLKERKAKEKEEKDIADAVMLLQNKYDAVNSSNSNIIELTKVIEDYNSQIKKLVNKINDLDKKIKNQEDTNKRIKAMFE